MNPIIKKLETPEECEAFIKEYSKLINQARQRAVELRAKKHDVKHSVEEELFKVLYAYEEVLTKKNGRRTRAGRTWPMVHKYGIIGAAERAVNRKVDPQGYRYLVEMGLQHLTFEAVIANNPNVFSTESLKKAKERLNEISEL